MDDSKLSTERVKHIAHLARIGLDEHEVEKFSKQLDTIISYMKILDEVDTQEIPETTQLSKQNNIMRDDQVKASVSPDALLDCSTLPKLNHQITVKAVIKE